MMLQHEHNGEKKTFTFGYQLGASYSLVASLAGIEKQMNLHLEKYAPDIYRSRNGSTIFGYFFIVYLLDL